MPNPSARIKATAVLGLTALAAVLAAAPARSDASGTAMRSGSTDNAGRSAAAPGDGAKQSAAPARGKAGSGISVSAKIDGAPAAGQPVTITLSFTGVSDPAGATVNVSADTGLQLSGTTSATLTPGGNTTMTLTASANADGVYFLNVLTRQGALAGASSVPVKIGAGQMTMEKQGQVKTAPSGERVISMPAK